MIPRSRCDSRLIKAALALSLLVHVACTLPLDFLNPFQLRGPVAQDQPVMVELRDPPPTAGDEEPAVPIAAPATVSETPSEAVTPPAARLAEEPAPPLPAAEAAAPPAQAALPPLPDAMPGSVVPVATAEDTPLPVRLQAAELPLLPPPVRSADEFLADDRELLSYRISMAGIPVGNAELEAEKENGELRITLRVKSNAAFSQIYPVDDSVETRHICGNFILSRIRQREGSYVGDKGFTLFLRDKKVFWIDRLRNTSISEPLPDSSVVDILSGLYYLRNRPLDVGAEEVLHLFDGNRYVSGTVAVVGKERLTLPGLREVDTLLIHPQIKTAGIFRRTGDILIWLTDDRHKVPVKVETSIPLGKVTAVLVSARTERPPDRAGEAADRTTGETLARQRSAAVPVPRTAVKLP